MQKNECMYEGQKKTSKFLVTFHECSIQIATVTRLRAGHLRKWGSVPKQGQDFALLIPSPAQKTIPVCTNTRSFPGVKQLEYKVDHSPPPTVKVKNSWSSVSIPAYAFMAWCLIKQRQDF